MKRKYKISIVCLLGIILVAITIIIFHPKDNSIPATNSNTFERFCPNGSRGICHTKK